MNAEVQGRWYLRCFGCYNFMMNLKYITFQGHSRSNIWVNEDLLSPETDTEHWHRTECRKYLGKDLAQGEERCDYPQKPFKWLKVIKWFMINLLWGEIPFYEKRSWDLPLPWDLPWCLSHLPMCRLNTLWVPPAQELGLWQHCQPRELGCSLCAGSDLLIHGPVSFVLHFI